MLKSGNKFYLCGFLRRRTYSGSLFLSTLPAAVTLVEVGPRDGLQNEKKIISSDSIARLIELLSGAGLNRIEAASFVSPTWVPQMANSAKVIQKCSRNAAAKLMALVPNMTGMHAALKCEVDEIAVFTSASEIFCWKNLNCSINDSLIKLLPVCEEAKRNELHLRGYISCSFRCPFEGEVPMSSVLIVASKLLEMGCEEICLADTTGASTPMKTRDVLKFISSYIPLNKISVHFHDTYGQGLANILISLEQGITTVDASIGGLGGCPYAPGATGNVATEDVLYMLDGCGVSTGVDMKKLLEVSRYVQDNMGLKLSSKVAHATLLKCP